MDGVLIRTVYTVTVTSREDGCYGQHFCGVFREQKEAVAAAKGWVRNGNVWSVREWDMATQNSTEVATNDERLTGFPFDGQGEKQGDSH